MKKKENMKTNKNFQLKQINKYQENKKIARSKMARRVPFK